MASRLTGKDTSNLCCRTLWLPRYDVYSLFISRQKARSLADFVIFLVVNRKICLGKDCLK